MAKRSKRTPLTHEIIKNVCDALRGGNIRQDSCAYAGIRYTTFCHWLKEGKESSAGLKRELYDAVQKAESDAIVRNVAIIQKAAQKTWQAAAWWLERKYPESWSSNRDQLKMLIKEITELKKMLANGSTTITSETGSPIAPESKPDSKSADKD